MKKKITIVSPCFNESENIDELYSRINNQLQKFDNYDFDYIFIDNASNDDSLVKLKKIALTDKRVKLIVNSKNFGHIRSPYWAILQSKSDATIYLASDLQDPPELIESLIKEWEAGFKVVLCVKKSSSENRIFFWMRKKYYLLLDFVSDVEIVKNSTGFGLYDKKIIDILKQINDPYPFLRGLIAEIGYDIKTIEFRQPARSRGFTKNSIYDLYDIGILGLISQSIVPIRSATFLGFILGILSISISIVTIVLKIIYWDSFAFGVAPFVATIMFVFGIILIFLGILGEYITLISRYVRRRPIVIERERINFEE